MYGDFDEEIYMRISEGLDLPEGHCLLLQKSIYGLAQTSREWWKKFVMFLVDGFTQSDADPCIFGGKAGRESGAYLSALMTVC